MSEVQVPVVESPAVVPPTTETPKPRTMADQLPEGTLALRLEQARETERKKVLAELGVSDLDAAKSAVVAARAADEAKKSEAERLAAATLRVTNLEAALGFAVAHAAKGITPEQKAAVDAIAGNDQALWLRTYGTLATTWGAPPMEVPPAVIAAPAAPPPPATTAPIGTVPTASTTSPVNHQAVWSNAGQANPFAAADYLLKHPEAAKRT